MRLLLVNWQDRENPQAGGAETHLHEIFGRLAARGHDVRAVVAGWKGSPSERQIDGIRLTRTGRRHTFPFFAPHAARHLLRDAAADLVVEDINKIPLYSPLWSPVPVVALVPHLFGTTAFREASWPVASLVWCSERPLSRIYRKVPFQAISESTARDLARRGVDAARIRVIPPGIDHEVYRPGGPRDEIPTVVYVGRLKRYKGLDIVLRAVALLLGQGMDVRLVLGGRGDDRPRLERLARKLCPGEAVRFLGFVPEADKVRWLQRAWVAVYPSPKEGWGIGCVEAAACGTPVVASDAPGLRESVSDGASGLLVEHGRAEAWADALRRLIRNAELRERLGKGAIEHAARFSWDRAAAETERHLREALAEVGNGRAR